MPENAGVDPQGSRAARAPRGLVLVAVLALAVGLAVAANTLGERSTQPPFRTPSADVTTLSGPTPTDSTTTDMNLVETALPDIGGLALGGQPITTSLTRSDPTAVKGPWTVVVRRADGSLGRYGAVVTYPVRERRREHRGNHPRRLRNRYLRSRVHPLAARQRQRPYPR